MSIFIDALIETTTDWLLDWFGKDRVYAGRKKDIEAWLTANDTLYPHSADEVLTVLEALRLRDLIITSQVEVLDECWRECTCRPRDPFADR